MKKFILLLFLPMGCFSQELPDSLTGKIDNIFKSFSSSTPGCALAVVKNGQVMYKKGYGMANLEYKIPIEPQTIFHIASESKQYVAFCMLLLEKEGKLSLDDDIRKHLDFVPDFGHTITIRHLIYHTSGLRDQWQLLANAGWQLDDVITQDHVIKLVSRQKALNFTPGEEYMYCNTGYTLMAEIVKKVSGLSLREYTARNIFNPLGMNHTHFHDNYQELVPNRAYSYSPSGTGFQHAVLSYSIVGATSLFTTVEDEAKWLMNYETGQVGGKELIEKMYETGKLNDGRKLNYAFAINIDNYKGWKQIGHGGADAGYRTYACRYPELNLAIVVFSNSGVVDPGSLTRKVADLILPEKKESEKPATVQTFADSSFHRKLQGLYVSDRGNQLDLEWKDGKLIRRGQTNNSFQFISSGNNRYTLPDGGPVLILDEKNKTRDSVQELTMEFPNQLLHYKRVAASLTLNTSEYTGRYYNDETEAYYSIVDMEGKLFLDHRKFNRVPLRLLSTDQFSSPYWWMNHIRFLRDRKGKVTAFEVNGGRILHLKYIKQK